MNLYNVTTFNFYVSNDTFNKTVNSLHKAGISKAQWQDKTFVVFLTLGSHRTTESHTDSVELSGPATILSILTKTRHESTKQNVPERPMPAEQ
jgi:hypothetical protein